LCFIHEDVLFANNDWGKSLIEKFESDTQAGVIGIAGSKYKSLSPGPGWYNGREDLDRLFLIQHNTSKNSVTKEDKISTEYEEVVSLDGVFLFTTKAIWEANKFDEKTFTDFHCYDIDFSLSVLKSHKLFITNRVLLEHFSSGNLDDRWLKETLKLSRKWKSVLPLGVIEERNQKNLEWSHKTWFLAEMIKYHYPFRSLIKVLFGFGFIKFFSVSRTVSLLKVLLLYKLEKNNA
jgi:hypothetical protein